MIFYATGPDFGPNYPSGGKSIGPAWGHMWDMLSAGTFACGHLLAAEVSALIVTSTALNLLRNARKAGLVEVKRKKCTLHDHRGVSVAHYRIKVP